MNNGRHNLDVNVFVAGYEIDTKQKKTLIFERKKYKEYVNQKHHFQGLSIFKDSKFESQNRIIRTSTKK